MPLSAAQQTISLADANMLPACAHGKKLKDRNQAQLDCFEGFMAQVADYTFSCLKFSWCVCISISINLPTMQEELRTGGLLQHEAPLALSSEEGLFQIDRPAFCMDVCGSRASHQGIADMI